MDVLMSGLWRGWNLICTSCRALKKETGIFDESLWITKRSLTLRRFLFTELIPLEYALVFSAHDGRSRSWSSFSHVTRFWHTMHFRDVSQHLWALLFKSLLTHGDKNTSLPQNYAGLLPDTAILNTLQLEIFTGQSSFCYEQKEFVS